MIGDLQWYIDPKGRKRPLPSAELVKIVRDKLDTLILGISGKDSLAMWLYLREWDFKIIPFALYTVPGGLSFEVEAADYYEDFFKTKIYRAVHPSFFEFYRNRDFQSPLTWRRPVRVPVIEYREIENEIAKRHNLPDDYLSAIGFRAADNPGRRRMINNMGAIYWQGTRHYYYAIWDWTIGQVMQKIRQYGAKLSRSYAMFGCTFDNYNWNELVILQRECPDDYQKLKFFFPLIGAKVIRFFGVK